MQRQLFNQRLAQLSIVVDDQDRALIGHGVGAPWRAAGAPSFGNEAEVEHSGLKEQARTDI
jgi:hypothetical protein